MLTKRYSHPRPFGRLWSLGGVFVCWLAWTVVAGATPSLTLTWDPSADTDVQGYTLHYGLTSGAYSDSLNVGPSTTAEISSLTAGSTYYFAVTAYNVAGVESLPSNEVLHMVPVPPPATLLVESLDLGSEPGETDLVVTDIGCLNDGSYEFKIEARSASSFTIYESSDLFSWRVLGTLANPTGGLLVRDLAGIDLERRFYRVEPDP